MAEPPRSKRRMHLASLGILCIIGYFFGLTTHGLTNWQESQRALVAREMHQRNEWIVPTVHGDPYIAKPPMIYWCQRAVAHARSLVGVEPFQDEFELRFVVALAGTIGVLATYFAARSMLADPHRSGLGDDAAFLAALGLASGVLYARSSRIGELDVLTVPFVVTSVALVQRAWRRWKDHQQTDWLAVFLAAAAATGAALTKGPPALLVVAIAGFGPPLLWSTPRTENHPASSAARRVAILLAAVLTMIVAMSRGMPENAIEWFGLLFFGVLGAVVIAKGLALAEPTSFASAFRAMAHTHPLLVLGLPVLVIWAWGRLVAARVGSMKIAELASIEAQDNLRLLVLDSPGKNLGFMLYGVAPIALAALIGFIWLIRDKPLLTTTQRVPAFWAVTGFATFSSLGKGVARYLTPIWPAVAMVGGLWLARALADYERQTGDRRPRIGVVALFFGMIVAQSWWYGTGREIHFGWRSPRALVREVLASNEPARLGVWRIAEPALDFYAGERVEVWSEVDAAFESKIRSSNSPYVLLVVEDTFDVPEPIRRLRDQGFRAERIETRSVFRWRSNEQPVHAWRVEP